jgi:hypothetical protein
MKDVIFKIDRHGSDIEFSRENNKLVISASSCAEITEDLHRDVTIEFELSKGEVKLLKRYLGAMF